jgi:hypothetical protein
MAYSQIGIVNLALLNIGVGSISALNEGTPQSIAANAAWEYVLNEVLEAKDWNFAKTRASLAVSDVTPVNNWSYAYPLPSDFLRLVSDYKNTSKDDPAIYPMEMPYIIETLATGTSPNITYITCLFTDYDNTSEDLIITYIRKVTDPSKYTAHFITALAFRLAAQLAVSLTESRTKFSDMMQSYRAAIVGADALNQTGNYLEDEKGSSSWEDAGR